MSIEQVTDAAECLLAQRRAIRASRSKMDAAAQDLQDAEKQEQVAMRDLLKVAGVGPNLPLRAISCEGEVVIVRWLSAKENGSPEVDVTVANAEGLVR